MVICGKLNMDEFAMGSTNETSYCGPVKNADTSRVSGSPGGPRPRSPRVRRSALLLGYRQEHTPAASYCGVTGLKPTYGAVSRYGLAYASSLDQIGPVARDVADCAAILGIICGHDRPTQPRLTSVIPTILPCLTGRGE